MEPARRRVVEQTREDINMSSYNRREFLGKVGVGMLASAGGWAVANKLDLLGIVYRCSR